MVGSFFVTNYTRYRPEFLEIIQDAGPVIYLIFFTLVGDALRLDILAQTLLFTFIIFGVRLAGLFVGSIIGGTIARDPSRHNRVAWMAYITQAGIGLGLAREAAVEFPQLGEEFTTLIISAIVLSQIVGPPFLNYVIRWVGEARLQAHAEPDEIRDAVILGVGGQPQALARQLMAHNWQVILADTDPEHVEHIESNSDCDIRLLPDISYESLSKIVTPSTDALVVMLDDDAANLAACELAYEHCGVPRLVAQLNDYSMVDRFRELGVQVVYPASAMVNLLDQSVRAPQTAALLMHEAAGNETVQITITNPDIDNLRLRDLRLPVDVLVLGIMRDGTSILPHGHTVMKFNDEVTLIGNPSSLEQVTLRFGF
jgi:Trk K+ transport system NAD-binding subunit